MIEAFPLYWPEHRPRTERFYRETAKFRASFAAARDELMRQLTMLVGGRWMVERANIIISTNVALRWDGLPLANQREPDDPGVAVYFTWKKRQVCLACDRWRKVAENMQAIAKTIDAIRGIARWGTGDMIDAAFRGFEALPAPGSSRSWRDVLGLASDAPLTIEAARAAYRMLAAVHHPDRGGSHERMAEINRAWDEAQRSLGGA